MQNGYLLGLIWAQLKFQEMAIYDPTNKPSKYQSPTKTQALEIPVKYLKSRARERFQPTKATSTTAQ